MLLAALAGPAAALAQVTVRFDAGNPPFMYESDGAASGIYPVLFAEAFRRAGVKASLEAVPWKRALAELDAGQAGVGGIYKNAERAAKYDYSSPYFVERVGIYAATGNDLTPALNGLLGKRVGALRAWSYGDAFDAAVADGAIAREDVDSDDLNFRKLGAGRLDAVLAIVESGDAQLKALKLEGRVKLCGLLITNPVHLAFAKSAGLKDVLALFDRAMQSMKKDGTFDAIVRAEMAKRPGRPR